MQAATRSILRERDEEMARARREAIRQKAREAKRAQEAALLAAHQRPTALHWKPFADLAEKIFTKER